MMLLTKTEKRVLLITGIFLFIGLGSKYFSIREIVFMNIREKPYIGIIEKASNTESNQIQKGVLMSRERMESESKKSREPVAPKLKPVFPIDLNTASESNLTQIKGIGPKLAKSIVDYRQKHGPFTKIDQITNVKGIGNKKLVKISPFVRI